MFIKAHLAWMDGYPVDAMPAAGGVAWQPIVAGGGAVIHVDRDYLHRANYAIKKLRRRFPRALPKIVGDVDAWAASRVAVLETLKPAVHRAEALAATLFQIGGPFASETRKAAMRLGSRHPALADVVAAVSWTSFGDDKRAVETLAWMTEWAPQLTTLVQGIGPDVDARYAVLTLWALSRAEGPGRTACLVRTMGEPFTYEAGRSLSKDARDHVLAALEVAERLGSNRAMSLRAKVQKLGKSDRTRAPAAALWAHIQWLKQQRSATRRRALRLFELSRLQDPLDQWCAWHLTLDGAMSYPATVRADDLRRDRPAPLNVVAVLRAVEAAAAAKLKRFFAPIADLLDTLHEAECDDLCTAALIAWSAQAGVCSGSVSSSGVTAAWFIRFLRLTREYALQQDFRSAWGLLRRRWIVQDLAETLTKPDQLGRWLQAVAAVNAVLPEPLDDPDEAITLIEAGCDATFTAAVVCELSKREVGWLDSEVLQAAAVIADGEAGVVADICQAWKKRPPEEYSVDEEGLAALAKLFAQSNALAAVRRLATGGHLTRLAAFGTRFRLAHKALNQAPGPPSFDAVALPQWAERFPATLHDPLARLAGAHPQAEAAANRLLRRDFPSRKKMEEELQAIEQKLVDAPPEAATRLAARRKTITGRLRGGNRVSARRAARLGEKIEHSAALALWTGWCAAFDDFLAAALPRMLNLDQRPDWLLLPSTLDVLVGVVRLKKADRRLAERLLRARCGPPPWDLRDDPANHAYLERMKARGIDMGPWLSGLGSHEVKDGGSEPLRFVLEDDPLNVFAMGAHFGTCLRPGAMNFYSVVANAADINKRVLYARRTDGGVVGRCLLALSDIGELLAFEPYCHDSDIGFENLVRDFAMTLAGRMNTKLAAQGSVPTLVAPRWYDDSSRDLTGELEALASGSAFRTSLLTIAAEDLVEAMDGALDGNRNTQLLAMVVSLPELHERPELIVALAPRLIRASDLPDDCRLMAVKLAMGCGERDLAVRLATDRLAARVMQSHRWYGEVDDELMQLLAEVNPPQALRVLRRTRDRQVRRWDQERHASRAYAAGRAMEHMQRARQAMAMYRLAVTLRPTKELRKKCRERIAALNG